MIKCDNAIQRLKDIGLTGGALASACRFIADETTKDAFVTADDLARIATANGWKNRRISVMQALGFRSMPPEIRICGVETRIWQRGVARGLKHTDRLPRYRPCPTGDVLVSRVPPLPY